MIVELGNAKHETKHPWFDFSYDAGTPPRSYNFCYLCRSC